MSFNITGFKPDIFFAFNTAIHITLFAVLALPAVLLHALIIVGLLLAKDIKWQIKTTLINIFIAQFVTTVGTSFYYIGYPIRAKTANPVSCDIGLGLLMTGFLSDVSATALYAITVFLFIKYGPKKMKWYVLVIYIAVSWTVYSIFGLLIATRAGGGAISSNGFCVYDESVDDSLPLVGEAAVGLVLFVNVCLVTIFGILTCCVRKNVSTENTDTKRAITKVLLYHSVKMLFLIGQFLFSAIAPIFQSPQSSKKDIVVFLVLEYIIIDVAVEVTALLTDIVSFCTLKPLRDALKGICPCCRPNSVSPTSHTGQLVEMETRMTLATDRDNQPN